MSTYLRGSTLRGQRVEAGGAERRRDGDGNRGRRSVLAVAWAELWKRTAGGSFERLPDPSRHPECWFKFL